MISLERLFEIGEDSCVHCSNKADAAVLVNSVYENYPEKINQRFCEVCHEKMLGV